MSRSPVSLEARALGFLARREYSRAELRARLASHASDPDALDAVLDQLAAKKLLSDQRFIDSLVRRRAGRFGAARIQHELRTHQLPAEQLAPALEALKASELARAREVWQKRFGEAPASREDRLRQMRFLAGRGFAGEVIRKVVGPVGGSSGVEQEPDDL
ncbi:MAG: recombination regulator RecX [Betaproteobacteria bacterium]|nr:recombination regulator RecX [Betaproteobacteria bacterium]